MKKIKIVYNWAGRKHTRACDMCAILPKNCALKGFRYYTDMITLALA